MNECEEPDCDKTAVKDWHGRKVCQDHYDKYRDNWDTIHQGCE